MTSTRARQNVVARIVEGLSQGAREPSFAVSDSSCDDARRRAGDIRARCDRQRAALMGQFQPELAAVGGLFHHALNAEAVCDFVVRIAATHHARSAIAWDVSLIDEPGLAKRLEEADIQFFTFGQGIRAEAGSAGVPPPGFRVAAGADIGITTVDYALADTGTLVLRSGDGRARSVSLLPPVQRAVEASPNNLRTG